MKTIKQLEQGGECVAACVAMLCGETLQETIERRMKLDQTQSRSPLHGTSLQQVAALLIQKGLLLGFACNWGKGVCIDPSSESAIELQWHLKDHDALLTACAYPKSRRCHTVVWDCAIEKVRDPLPHLSEANDLRDYKLIQWFPVTHFGEHGWP